MLFVGFGSCIADLSCSIALSCIAFPAHIKTEFTSVDFVVVFSMFVATVKLTVAPSTFVPGLETSSLLCRCVRIFRTSFQLGVADFYRTVFAYGVSAFTIAIICYRVCHQAKKNSQNHSHCDR